MRNIFKPVLLVLLLTMDSQFVFGTTYQDCTRGKSPRAVIIECTTLISANSFNGFRLRRIYLSRGSAYEQIRDFDGAIKDYTKAISITPNKALPFIKRGIAYYKKGKREKAISDLELATRLDPNNSKAQRKLVEIQTPQKLAAELPILAPKKPQKVIKKPIVIDSVGSIKLSKIDDETKANLSGASKDIACNNYKLIADNLVKPEIKISSNRRELEFQNHRSKTRGISLKNINRVENGTIRIRTNKNDATNQKLPIIQVKRANSIDHEIVRIFYGTDRKEILTGRSLKFGGGRSRRLSLGYADITIPRNHKTGNVERPWNVKWLKLSRLEDPSHHFTVHSLKKLSAKSFISSIREKLDASQKFKDHAFIFIHGFRFSFENALFRTAQIAYDLNFDGLPFLYSWPSQGELTEYLSDKNNSEQSIECLQRFIDIVASKSNAKHIHLIAHSMGNEPLLKAIQNFDPDRYHGRKISEIILIAPDIDRDVFENLARKIDRIADGATLYASANDVALKVSKKFQKSIRAGDIPEQGPIVVSGLDTIDISAISTDVFSTNHSAAIEKRILLGDISRLIRGMRPPDRRTTLLKEIKTPKGNYWQYPP